MPNADDLVAFYAGAGCDARGRTLEDVWALGPGELESSHDYIQWLFPLMEPSRAQPQSPVLTADAAEAVRRSPAMRERLIQSARVMARFYGFAISEAGGTWTVAPSEAFEQRKRVWVTPYDHNYLRQTRILKSLTLLGLEPLARAWLECLTMVYRANAEVVGHETFEYWRAAVG
jgi:hypothetical protein